MTTVWVGMFASRGAIDSGDSWECVCAVSEEGAREAAMKVLIDMEREGQALAWMKEDEIRGAVLRGLEAGEIEMVVMGRAVCNKKGEVR